jgi:hypothetical protein
MPSESSSFKSEIGSSLIAMFLVNQETSAKKNTYSTLINSINNVEYISRVQTDLRLVLLKENRVGQQGT